MGLRDTGLSSTITNEADVAPNNDLEQPRIDEDSDFDLDEDDQWGGYMPLAQNPNDAEPLYALDNDSEDEEINSGVSASSNTPEGDHTHMAKSKSSSIALVEEVWSKPAPKEVDIEMSEKKIDLVKQVMLNIQLPSEAIPAWAKNIPEEEWKNHLMQRLKDSDK